MDNYDTPSNGKERYYARQLSKLRARKARLRYILDAEKKVEKQIQEIK